MITIILNFAYLSPELTQFLALSFNLFSSNLTLQGREKDSLNLLPLQLLLSHLKSPLFAFFSFQFFSSFFFLCFLDYSTPIHPTFPHISCFIDLSQFSLLFCELFQHVHNLLKVNQRKGFLRILKENSATYLLCNAIYMVMYLSDVLDFLTTV